MVPEFNTVYDRARKKGKMSRFQFRYKPKAVKNYS